MARCKYYHYFVEGEDEEKVLEVLKSQMRLIVPGKIERFNVVEKKLKKLHLMRLKQGTAVVLVFDTDTGNIKTLNENIFMFQKMNFIVKVLCITQVDNLEDELKRSCNIKQIKDLTGSKSNREFKHDLIREKRLDYKLKQCQFNFSKFWAMQAKGEYECIGNDAEQIKVSAK